MRCGGILIKLHAIFDCYKERNLLHINELFDFDLPIWNSSPGSPYRHHGYKTTDEIKFDPLHAY